MKKFTSIFAMLLIAFVVTFSACSSMTMASAIADINSQCPVDYGDMGKMTSATIDGNGDAVMTIETSLPSSVFTSDEMKKSLNSMFDGEDDLVKLMKDSNTKLIYRIKCSDDVVDITFSATDF